MFFYRLISGYEIRDSNQIKFCLEATMKCWAKGVSECCSTQSREHYITKGLFSDKTLLVDNAQFLGGGIKEIAKASLTKKCLCKRHNEQLSEYDEEAIRFGDALKYCLELSAKRRNSTAKKFSLHRKNVDADRFSRWFLKTYLGLFEFFSYPSSIAPETLAALVFSESTITNFLKLEISMAVSEEFQIVEAVSIAPLERDEKTIGMQMQLYGVRLNGFFSDKPECNQEPLKIRFNEYKQGKSCEIRFR